MSPARNDRRTPLVLHDYFDVPDGGGRTALLAARALEADLCYGFRRPDHPYWPDYAPPGRELALGAPLRTNLLRQWTVQRRFLTAPAFLRDRDVSLYSGSYAPLAVLNTPARRNICYCHTPPRFLYDQRDRFLAAVPPPVRPFYRLALRRFRERYERAMRAMDAVLANSRNVQERISRFLGLESFVVPPPCEMERYAWAPSRGYFLSTARHDPLKRVDVILEAFAALPDRQLVVISEGAESAALRRRAEALPNVTFLGRVDEARARRLLSECRATIYVPREEDFGLSPVESMAAGKPVLGVAEGGLLETVLPDETGVLIPAGQLDAPTLAAAVRSLGEAEALGMREACLRQAARFSSETFGNAVRDHAERLRNRLPGPKN